MNILFLNNQEFNPRVGGVERVTDTLTREFLKKKINVHYVFAEKDEFSKDFISPVKEFILPSAIPMNFDENIHFLTNLIHHNKIDIIINQAGNIRDYNYLCEMVKEKTKVKLISALHIDPEYRLKSIKNLSPSLISQNFYFNYIKRFGSFIKYYFKIKKKEKKLLKEVYASSDRVVLLSEHFFNSYKKVARIKETSKLEAIWNPLSFSDKCEPKAKKKQLLYVGRLDQPHKGNDRLLYLWKKLETDFKDWNLLILGDGPFRPEMENYIAKNQLKNVTLLGFKNPLEYYQDSSILCLTSTYEGFGMVLIEAMQNGCIPVAFNSFESIEDIITNNVTGYLVTPFKLNDFSHRLKTLMSNESKRKKMSVTASNSIEKFNVNDIIARWIILFNELLKKQTTMD